MCRSIWRWGWPARVGQAGRRRTRRRQVSSRGVVLALGVWCGCLRVRFSCPAMPAPPTAPPRPVASGSPRRVPAPVKCGLQAHRTVIKNPSSSVSGSAVRRCSSSASRPRSSRFRAAAGRAEQDRVGVVNAFRRGVCWSSRRYSAPRKRRSGRRRGHRGPGGGREKGAASSPRAPEAALSVMRGLPGQPRSWLIRGRRRGSRPQARNAASTVAPGRAVWADSACSRPRRHSACSLVVRGGPRPRRPAKPAPARAHREPPHWQSRAPGRHR